MEKHVDINIEMIIDVMLDFYVKEYIKFGKKFIESNHLDSLFKIADYNFKNIEKKTIYIKEKIINPESDLIPTFSSDNVFYFFTLLKNSMPKYIDDNKIWTTTNNVYFDRKITKNIYLQDSIIEENTENSKNYLKDFFFDYKLLPIINYVGSMHMLEILIRAIFFFEFSYKLKDKEKELMLNYFTWMIINNYKNFYQDKNGYWRVAYYFKELLKFLFFESNEMILPYEKGKSNNKNIKKTIKESYKNTTNKIYSLTSSDLMGVARSDIVFPNNLQQFKIDKFSKTHLIAPPFFMKIGKDYDKKVNKFFLYIAITTFYDYKNNFIWFNNIISYTEI
jgi:hypothetical protein